MKTNEWNTGNMEEPPLISEDKRIITSYTGTFGDRDFRFDFVLPPTVYNNIMSVNEALQGDK